MRIGNKFYKPIFGNKTCEGCDIACGGNKPPEVDQWEFEKRMCCYRYVYKEITLQEHVERYCRPSKTIGGKMEYILPFKAEIKGWWLDEVYETENGDEYVYIKHY